MIGDTFVVYLGFIVFLDFVGFNYRLGRLIGVNEQFNNKFPLSCLSSDDNYKNPDSRASNFGFHTILSLMCPLLSSFAILNLQIEGFFVGQYAIYEDFNSK